MKLGLLKYAMLVVSIMGATSVVSQQPFGLDVTFRTNLDENFINSIYPFPDGKLLISGKFVIPGLQGYRYLSKLNLDGSRDLSFTTEGFGGGRLTAWEDKFYVFGGQIVRRIHTDGKRLELQYGVIRHVSFTPRRRLSCLRGWTSAL